LFSFKIFISSGLQKSFATKQIIRENILCFRKNFTNIETQTDFPTFRFPNKLILAGKRVSNLSNEKFGTSIIYFY